MNEVKTFQFKELDEEGLENLDVISEANKFNRWMFDTIEPHCGKKVLEVGSGIGNISKFFFDKPETHIDLSDIRQNYRDYLEQHVSKKRGIQRVLDLDIVDTDFDKKHYDLFNFYDSIFALNVVEHIEDDRQALINSGKLIKKGGTMIILVPAYQFLYNTFDVHLEHYRRYTKKSLKNIFPENFEMVHTQYFNAAGMAGWFVTGSLMKKKTIPSGQMKLYNSLVPIFKGVDKLLFNQMGLSVIVVGKKIK